VFAWKPGVPFKSTKILTSPGSEILKWIWYGLQPVIAGVKNDGNPGIPPIGKTAGSGTSRKTLYPSIKLGATASFRERLSIK